MAVHKGTKLENALAALFGLVMNRPDLITATVIGDGERETGPTAGAWHVHLYVNPKESGAVASVDDCF